MTHCIGHDHILRRCIAVVDIIGNAMNESDMFNECRKRIDNEVAIISNSHLGSTANGSADALLSVVRIRTALMTLKTLACGDPRTTNYTCIFDTVLDQLDHEVVRYATNIKLTEEEARRRFDAQTRMYLREIDVLEYENEMLRQENNELREEKLVKER